MIIFLSPTDVVMQTFREKQQTATPDCTRFTHYIFQWSSLVKSLSKKSIHIKRVYLRTYLKIDQRNENEKIMLTSTVSMYNGKRTTNDAHMHEGGSLTAQQTQEVTLAQVPGQWIEIDLTKAVQELMPYIEDSTNVHVTVKETIDCANQIEAPPSFIQPAEIPFEIRESIITFQPFLVVFADDDITKQTFQTKKNAITEKKHPSKADRGKRSPSDACQKHNQMVVFSEIGLNGTVPHSINIGRCSGSCSHSHINQQTSPATNHAKVMSSVKQIRRHLPHKRVSLNGRPTTPCCVPASYNPQTTLFIIDGDDMFSSHSYWAFFNDIEIISCSCQ